MGEVKYSMKARVKILVNGAAATLLTGAVAAGLILSSTGALQTKNNDVLAARELDETQEEMTREQEPQTEANAELVSAERYQLGMLWEHELTAKKTTEKSTESDEKNTENEKRSSSASSAKSPLASYFSDQALVNPNTVGNYLNMRVQADESAEVVNTIKAEELVSVLGEDGDWSRRYGGLGKNRVPSDRRRSCSIYAGERNSLCKSDCSEYEYSSSSYNICRYFGCSIRI